VKGNDLAGRGIHSDPHPLFVGFLLEGVSDLLIWYPLLRTSVTSFTGEDHDYPSAALSILSRDRYRETWSIA
jgi:hypothetical protein